jgi:hypothetical protein
MRNLGTAAFQMLCVLLACEFAVVVYLVRRSPPDFSDVRATTPARSNVVELPPYDGGRVVAEASRFISPAHFSPTHFSPARYVPAVHVERYANADEFAFDGRWEHVRGLIDGRFHGASSRSFHPGAAATLTFDGSFVRLFGIVGPGGGRGLVEIDGGRERHIANFTAPQKRPNVVVFASGTLPPGHHRLRVAVLPAADGTRGGYVNLGGAAYGG